MCLTNFPASSLCATILKKRKVGSLQFSLQKEQRDFTYIETYIHRLTQNLVPRNLFYEIPSWWYQHCQYSQ